MTESPLTPRIKENIHRNICIITENIIKAAELSGRNPEDIKLMAVTKTVHPDLVNYAFEEGITIFGENRVQEFESKSSLYHFDSRNTHFIGTLQKNKINKIVSKVQLIESVNSVDLVYEINKKSNNLNIVSDILLELNIGYENSKTGLDPSCLSDFLFKIKELKNINLRGLMCIPPYGIDIQETEYYFDKMANLFVDIKSQKTDNINIDILSMGMTSDYTSAIKFGSTQVRIGTGIFGFRD